MQEPLHILLIGDKEGDLRTITEMLNSFSETDPVVLQNAGTLSEGLRAIDQDDIDAVLLDLRLSDSRCEETFGRLYSRAPSLPTIILTDIDDEDCAFSSVQQGAQEYLIRGHFHAGNLLHSIRHGIERLQLIRKLESKNAELEEVGSRLKTIIDSNTDGMLIVDDSGIIEFANHAAEVIFGRTSGELMGAVFGELITHEGPAEICIMQPKQTRVTAEMRVVKTVWKHKTANLVILRDITRRKASEEALRLYREHLKEMVRRRTAELLKANEDLSETINQHTRTEAALRESLRQLEIHSRAQLDFVSNVSHELKTPLSSISYAVGNLLSGVTGELSDRTRTYLTMMSEDIDRLAGTIGDILDMSRIEARTLVLQQEKLHLARLVLHAISIVQEVAAAKDQHITFSAKHDIAFVSVDPKRFERVILNIVGNAMKYTPDGGLIEVRLFSKRSEPETIYLTITDNGIGIAPNHIERVTERYYRVGEHVDGTGLGLALCKDITELHGGTLAVTSPPEDRDKGTCVTLALPTTSPPVVLVVDDEEIVRKVIRRQLERQGYQVMTCESGEEALNLIEKKSIHVLVADILLQDIDGIELISRIKTNPQTQQMPIVVVTGTQLQPSQLSMIDGFDIPVMTKPWKDEELVAAIEDTSAGRHFQRDILP